MSRPGKYCVETQSLVNTFVIPVSCFKYAYIDIKHGVDFVVYSESKMGCV